MGMPIGHGTRMTTPPMHRGGRTTRRPRHRRAVLIYRPCRSTCSTSTKTNTAVMRLPTSVVRRLRRHGPGRPFDCRSTTIHSINLNRSSPTITTTRNIERRTPDRPCPIIATAEGRATPTSSRIYSARRRRHDAGGRGRSMLDMRDRAVGWWI